MDERINKFVDQMAEFLAKRPGMLPLVGLLLIILNFLLQIFPGFGYWIVDANLLLHLGLILAILGLLLIRPLG